MQRVSSHGRLVAAAALLLLLIGACSAAIAISGSDSDDGKSSSAWSEQRSAAGQQATLLHLPLRRDGATSYKLRQAATDGNPHAERMLRASKHGAHIERLEQEQRRQDQHTFAVEDPRWPSTQIAPQLGCPFADFTIALNLGEAGVFNLIADTGSSTLAVAGDKCGNCGVVNPVWSATTSGAYPSVELKSEMSTSYGGGQRGWIGNGWRERVVLAASDPLNPSTAVDLATPDMRIAVVLRQSSPGSTAGGASNSAADNFFFVSNCGDDWQTPRMGAINMQGIVGLGFQPLAISGTDAWMQKMFAANTGIQTLFSMRLCTHSGSLWIGGADPASYSGTPLYTPVTRAAYWQVGPADMSVDGVSLGFDQSSWGSAAHIVDSGTTQWQLPPKIYHALITAIQANEKFRKYFRADDNDSFFSNTSQLCEASLVPGVSLLTLQKELPTISLTFANGVQLTMDGVGSYLIPCSSAFSLWTPGISPAAVEQMIGGWPLMNVS